MADRPIFLSLSLVAVPTSAQKATRKQPFRQERREQQMSKHWRSRCPFARHLSMELWGGDSSWLRLGDPRLAKSIKPVSQIRAAWPTLASHSLQKLWWSEVLQIAMPWLHSALAVVQGTRNEHVSPVKQVIRTIKSTLLRVDHNATKG